MKNYIRILVMVLTPVAAWAQWSNDLTLHIAAGISVPASSNDLAKRFQIDTVMNPLALNYSSQGMTYSFAENWRSGFSLSGGLGYDLTQDLSVLLTVSFQTFRLDKGKILGSIGLPNAIHVDDAELNAVTIGAFAKYQFRDFGPSVAPYLLGGIGVMNVVADDIYVLVDAYQNLTYRFESTNVFHASFGAGVDLFGSESSSMFVEAKVDVGLTQQGIMYFVPVRIGFRGGL